MAVASSQAWRTPAARNTNDPSDTNTVQTTTDLSTRRPNVCRTNRPDACGCVYLFVCRFTLFRMSGAIEDAPRFQTDPMPEIDGSWKTINRIGDISLIWRPRGAPAAMAGSNMT